MIEKPIPGFPGYYARSDGTIRTPFGSNPYGHILRGNPNNKEGHLAIKCKRPHWSKPYSQYVHIFIAKAFVHNPRPDIFDIVDHIDHDVTNNKPFNLRWLTHQLNVLHNKAAGCSFCKKRQKWYARVCVLGKSNFLGYFKMKEDASRVATTFRRAAFDRIYKGYIDEAPRTCTNLFWKESGQTPITRRPPLHDS